MKQREPGGVALMRNGHLLLLAIAVLAAAGLSAFFGLPRMEDPRIRNRNPTLITAFPGATAERVDALVTEPLEIAVREISEVNILRSESRPGVSLIRIEIDDFAPDPSAVFTRLRDKVADAIPLLPPGATPPLFEDQRRAVGYSLIVALQIPDEAGGEAELPLLGRLAKELSDRLRNVSGTEIVRRFGMPEEEVAVLVDPDELAALGLTPTGVAAQLAAADAKLPAGILRGERTDLDLETIGELDSLARLAEVPLVVEPKTGSVVRVGDVGKLERRGAAPPSQEAYSDGKRSILVAARITEETSIGDWTREARNVVAGFARGPGAGLAVNEVFVQERYVKERLGGLGFNLLLGAGVVMLVVFLLMGFRSAWIVGAALPLCTAAVLFILSVLGVPLHQMSIFGMIIALGLLIDNAIVVTDEVAKQLAEGADRIEAVKNAADHLRVPLLSSTLTTALSFAPILLLPGNVGDFIGSISVSVVTAITASFAIAMTIIIALAGRYLPRQKGRPTFWKNGLRTPRLRRLFERTLHGLLQRPLLTSLLVLAGCFLGFVRAGDLGLVFFPPADRDQIHLEVWLAPGSSLRATTRARDEVENFVRDRYTEVYGVHWVVGASFPAVYYNVIERRDLTPHLAHGIVDLDRASSAERVVQAMQVELREAFPELQVIARRFGQGPPIDAPVEVRLSGPSEARLRQLGEEVAAALRRHPSVLETRATMEAGRAKAWIEAPEVELRMLGLTPTDVSKEVRGWVDGAIGGTLLEGPEELSVRVRLPDEDRTTPEGVRSRALLAAARSFSPGTLPWIPLDALGELRLEPQPASITRFSGVPSNTIEAYLVDGVNPPDVSNAALAELEESGFLLPEGYKLAAGGDAAESGKAIGLLLVYAPVLLTLMIAALVLAFRSFALASVMFVVAIGATGSGLLALHFAGYPLGFNPFLGLAGLIGIAFNDAIVVLASLRSNSKARLGDLDAMVSEVIGCTRHVLSTTFTTMGGFLPLLLLDEGDFWPPIAVVIGGGVFGSTLLALGLVPALYSVVGAPLARRAEVTA